VDRDTQRRGRSHDGKEWGLGLNGVILNEGGNGCYIDGVGKRGTILRGGMAIPSKVMDKLAFAWLEHRNFVVCAKPE